MASGTFMNSQIASSSQSKPTIFQLIAADGLRSSIRPAIEHIVRFLNRKYATGTTKAFFQYCDEFCLLMELALEKHYLTTYNALFSEHFYGLARSSKGRSSPPILQSVIFSIVLPYIKLKCDRWFEKLRDDEADGIRYRKRILNLSRSYLLLIYPYLHMIYECMNLSFKVAYTLGLADHHQLWIRLSGVQLQNLTPELNQQFLAREEKIQNHRQLLPRITKSLAASLTFSLETGSFILQFLNWWQSQENPGAKDLYEHPIPKPPEIDPEISKTDCPLCKNPRRTDTLLSTSGYVFCYVCIVKYLREHGKCPITHFPTQEDRLIRIYSTT